MASKTDPAKVPTYTSELSNWRPKH